MAPGPVVKHFNVIKGIRPGQIPGFIDAFSDPFFYQRNEELLGHRIDAPSSCHAGSCPGQGYCAVSRHSRTICPRRPSKSQVVI